MLFTAQMATVQETIEIRLSIAVVQKEKGGIKMWSKIETMATKEYFAQERTKSIRKDIYTYGYKDGFTTALTKVSDILGSRANDAQRIDAICNLLDEYLKTDNNGNKQDKGTEGET